MLRIIRPRGRMILKSRHSQPVPLNFRSMLPKEPVLYAVNYGSFDQAVRLLVERRVRVDDLIGTCWPLSRYRDAIADAQANEQHKTFLLPIEE
jgi:L-iditol 2-dehydrogenase